MRCFGADRDGALAFRPPDELADANAALQTIGVDLLMAADLDGASLVHCHTWYANFAGHVAKLLHGVPHVATTHSLEPSRPWKAEQLGGGYRLSSFCERDGARGRRRGDRRLEGRCARTCSPPTRRRPARVHVILNGIDTEQYRPRRAHGRARALRRARSRSCSSSGGSRARRARPPARRGAASPERAQLVLAAGAPDTDEIARETEQAVARLERRRLDREDAREAEVIQLLSHAPVFVCPSIYEPLGIVNLEAMACGARSSRRAPAGSRRSSSTARRGARSAGRPGALARGDRRARRRPGARDALMGEAGRRRAVEKFGGDDRRADGRALPQLV